MSKGLFIKGAAVLHPDPLSTACDIRVRGDAITETGENLSLEGETVIEGEGLLAMPGLINSHTHSEQSLDRGVSPNLPLDLWLAWHVFSGIAYTSDDVYTAAAAGAVEMLRSGCTSVVDHVYLAFDRLEEQAEAVFAAYRDVGMRVGLAPLVGDLDMAETLPLHLLPEKERPTSFSRSHDPKIAFSALARFVDRYSGVHPTIKPMLGPSAPQRCSEEFLELLARLAKERGLHIHTHILESKSQVHACRERYGGSVIDYLAKAGLLHGKVSLAHCVWLDESDYETVRDHGAAVIYNPVSNLRTGAGILPLPELLKMKLKIGLGTDGAGTNDNQNMFEALKFGTLLHTLNGDYRNWPKPDALFHLCLRGGAAAIGEKVGRLEPGAKADIVLLKLDRHVLSPRENLIASLVFAEHGESVDTVIVGGRIVLREGTITTVSEKEIASRARILQRKIHAQYPRRRAFLENWEPFLRKIEKAVMETPLPVQRSFGEN